MRRSRYFLILVGVLTAATAFVLLDEASRNALKYATTKASGGYTVQQRIAQFSPAVQERMRPAFAAAGLAWPPRELSYIAFKDARLLEVHARDAPHHPWRFVHSYKVLAASGKTGPKLREGDRQVPEGMYRAESLNPNSRFHLSIRLNYPNDFDRRMGLADGRSKLGSDIMIHGSALSIGCLAMGDEAAEDLFIMSALATPGRTRILVSPTDFRRQAIPATAAQPGWVPALYQGLRKELQQYTTNI